MKKHRILIFPGLLTLAILIACYINYENNNIETKNFIYSSDNIPIAFENFKIVQISDLHNKEFGKGQIKLIEKIEKAGPDVIFITGDLIDRRRYHPSIAMEFVEKASRIAPIYYVSGNHEAWSGKYDEIQNDLLKNGVKVLNDQGLRIKIGNQQLFLYGLRDPDFLTTSYHQGTNTENVKRFLKKWGENKSFKILLSHRPELFDCYQSAGFDLVFCGHAHGGQIRLPFIGAIAAPDQKIFPRYTSGEYNKGRTTMYVSRGLGNSLFPVRINDRPEIIVVTLKTA